METICGQLHLQMVQLSYTMQVITVFLHQTEMVNWHLEVILSLVCLLMHSVLILHLDVKTEQRIHCGKQDIIVQSHHGATMCKD